MQLSGRMELQACRRRAAGGAAKSAADRTGRGKSADGSGRGLAAPAAAGRVPAASPEAIVYRLDCPPQPGSPFVVDLRVVRVRKSGGWSAGRALPSSQLHNAT